MSSKVARAQDIAQSKKAPKPVFRRREPAPRKRTGRPKRTSGAGSAIDQLKRNLTFHAAIEVDGYRARTGRQRVPKDEVLAFIRNAIPDFAKAFEAVLPKEEHHVFALDIYDAAFKTGRYKMLKR